MAHTKMTDSHLQDKKIVCLGGGIGTLNLIKGLRHYTENIAIVISMADDGGSGGRIRRLYNMLPPGDIVSCMSALTKHENELLAKLLVYRFPGDRYSKDEELAGHKLGNLIMVALRDLTGNFAEAILAFQKIFDVTGTFLPATLEPVTISINTKDGQEIHGEEAIDLGKYDWQKGIDNVKLHPENIEVNPEVVKAIQEADTIISGPGDLFTNILPILIVPGVKQALEESKAKKMLIINIANKPFETHGYALEDYFSALEKHIGKLPFDYIFVNNNHTIPMPEEHQYDYVVSKESVPAENIVLGDFVDEKFPLYHDSKKLASAITKRI